MIRLFSDVHSPFSLLQALPREAFVEPRATPEIGVRDVDDAFELSLDLPGVSPKDVLVSLDGAVLSLRAKREFTLADGKKEVRELSRRFRLPTKVDGEKTTAVLKDGVLTVRAAKLDQPTPRQIAVTAA